MRTFSGRIPAAALGLAVALRVAAAAPDPAGGSTWMLEGVDTVGGVRTAVLGAPRAAPAAEEGGGIVFDGVDDGLLVPVNPVAGLPRFTIEILFRPGAGGPAEQRFFHAEDAEGRRVLLETRMLTATTWCLDTFLRAGEAKQALIDRSRAHPAGRWTWVALTFDGKAMAHYVDGVRECGGAVDFGVTGPGQTSLGVRQNRVYWFKGAIREVRIHPEALPADKLQRIPAEKAVDAGA